MVLFVKDLIKGFLFLLFIVEVRIFKTVLRDTVKID